MVPRMVQNVLAESDAVFEALEQVIARQALVQDALDPLSRLVRRGGGVLVVAQLAQVLVQRRHRRHGGRLASERCVDGWMERMVLVMRLGCVRFGCVSAPMPEWPTSGWWGMAGKVESGKWKVRKQGSAVDWAAVTRRKVRGGDACVGDWQVSQIFAVREAADSRDWDRVGDVRNADCNHWVVLMWRGVTLWHSFLGGLYCTIC